MVPADYYTARAINGQTAGTIVQFTCMSCRQLFIGDWDMFWIGNDWNEECSECESKRYAMWCKRWRIDRPRPPGAAVSGVPRVSGV